MSEEEEAIKQLPVCVVNLKTTTETGFYVQFHVGKARTRLLVDSGAMKTFIDTKMWKSMRGDKTLSPVDLRFVLADGTPLPVEGSAEVDFRWGGRIFRHEVIVADLGEGRAILGLDFILKYDAVPYFKRGYMELGSTHVTLHREEPEAGCASISTNSAITIPDRTSVWVKVDIDEDLRPYKTMKYMGYGVVERDSNLMEEKGLVMPDQVVKVTDRGVFVHVINVHDEELTLDGGLKLGKISVVQDLKDMPPEDKKLKDLLGGTPNVNEIRTEPLLTREDLPEHIQPILNEAEDLSAEEVDKVCRLAKEYEDIFREPGGPNGVTNIVHHTIDIPEKTKPQRTGYRPVPRAKQEAADEEVDKLLNEGVIEPSFSPWAAPVVLAAKKDGGIRFCVDYRKVNQLTLGDAYPLPRIDETLDCLSGAKYFCSIDLAAGYWQIPLSEESKQYTAFITRKGLFQFKYMPFGLSNAPATFQRLMERVLMGLQWNICLCYLDDIIVFGGSFEETLTRLRTVLERIRAAGLKLKASKCVWFSKKTEFLGHIVSEKGIECDPKKIEAVTEWPEPTSATQVRAFIGFASYYRKFIPQFSNICYPLTRLTQKDAPFDWSDECQAAFDLLKQLLTTAPILSYPVNKGKYILDTDASNVAMGAVLSQVQDGEEKVIAYASKTFDQAERNYCTTKRELLAVVNFAQHFKHYLLGDEFLIRTDHASLIWLENFKNHADGILARWLSHLGCYTYKIEHRKRSNHGNADGMSRIPTTKKKRRCPRADCPECTKPPASAGVNAIGMEDWDIEAWNEDDMKRWQEEDPILGQVKAWLVEDPENRPNWRDIAPAHPAVKHYWATYNQLRLNNGILERKHFPKHSSNPVWQVVAPDCMREKILKALHNSPTGGHLGRNKLGKRVQSRFFWIGHRDDVARWCRECDICARTKPGPHRKLPPLGAADPVGGPLERIAIDIVGPLNETESGNMYIMVITDYFSKWTEAYALRNHTAQTVAEHLIEQFCSRWGLPKELHTDQGAEFDGHLIKHLCRILRIVKTRTCPYNPKSDGLVERFNRTMAAMLTTLVNDARDDWDDHLPYVMWAYRGSVHESTGFTPAMLMLGREVNLPIDLMRGSPEDTPRCPIAYVEWVRCALQEAFAFVALNMKKAAKRQRILYNRKTQEAALKIGENVMRWYTPNVRHKFGMGWTGPYIVVGKVNDLVYTVQKEEGGKCLNIHLGDIKKYEGNKPLNSWLVEEDDPEMGAEWWVDEEEEEEETDVDLDNATLEEGREEDLEEEVGGSDSEGEEADIELSQPRSQPPEPTTNNPFAFHDAPRRGQRRLKPKHDADFVYKF